MTSVIYVIPTMQVCGVCEFWLLFNMVSAILHMSYDVIMCSVILVRQYNVRQYNV